MGDLNARMCSHPPTIARCDLVSLSVLPFSDSSPIEVQRADALHDFLLMPTNAGESSSTLSGEFRCGRLDGVSGTLGFPSGTPGLAHVRDGADFSGGA